MAQQLDTGMGDGLLFGQQSLDPDSLFQLLQQGPEDDDLLLSMQLAEMHASAMPVAQSLPSLPPLLPLLPAINDGRQGNSNDDSNNNSSSSSTTAFPISTTAQHEQQQQQQQQQQHMLAQQERMLVLQSRDRSVLAALNLEEAELRDMEYRRLEEVMTRLRLSSEQVDIVKDVRRRLKNRESAGRSTARKRERSGRLETVNARLRERLGVLETANQVLLQRLTQLEDQNNAQAKDLGLMAQEQTRLLAELQRLRQLVAHFEASAAA